MSLRINTNVSAMQAYANLSANQTRLESSFNQLSSGLRINKAADDAAGLSIAQGLTSQINGLSQAVSNANDGINVAQIADGALGSVQDILQRMRGLVVKAGNQGTQDDKSLTAIQAEIGKLNEQLDKIAEQTKFGQTNLLDGSYQKVFQVGANGGDTIELDLKSGLNGLTAVDYAALTPPTSGIRSEALGVMLHDDATNTLDITMTLGGGVARAGRGTVTALNIVNYNDAGYTAYSELGVASAGTTTYGTAEATTDLHVIDAAIDLVSAARSGIGAVQNQLSYTVANLQTAITNVTASRSNLTDADLAEQVTAMTQSQILTQAATSVLSQANSAPQAILKLLQQ